MSRKKNNKTAINQVNKQIYLYSTILFVISFLLYTNTLTHDYALDDYMIIKDNRFTKGGIDSIGKILSNDMFAGHVENYKSDLSGGRYRPLSQVTFAIEYEIFGENPQFSHFINVILFSLTVILIFLSFNRLLNKDKPFENWLNSIPFLAALFFAVHPIHTEAVANIKGRDEIMSMLLVLVSFYYLLKYIDNKKITFWILSSAAFFLALLSKENSITYLAVIPLALVMLREKSLSESLKSIIPHFLAAFIFILIRQSVVGFSKQLPVEELMNQPFLDMSFFEKIGTVLYTFYVYLKLLFIPFSLTYDYYPYHIPKSAIYDFIPLIALAATLGKIYIAFRLYNQNKLISFSIFYFIITFSIVSNIFFSIGSFMNERFIYMPSLAVCLIFAWFISKYLQNKILNKNITMGILLAAAGIYSMITVTRNPVWKDNYTLMTNDVNTSYNSAFGNYAAGGQYNIQMQKAQNAEERNEYYQKATKHLYQALKIYPRYHNAYITLGNTHFFFNNNADSIIYYYKKAYEIYPANYDCSINLGRLMRDSKKNLKEAEFYFKNCIKSNPNNFEAYNELGVVYFNANYFKQAAEQFENALMRSPSNKQILLNLSSVYKALNDDQKANLYLNQANMLR